MQEEEIQFETSTEVKVIQSFDDMGLKEDLIRGIYAYSKDFSGELNLQILRNLRLSNREQSDRSSKEEMSLLKHSLVLVKLQRFPSLCSKQSILH